MNCVFCRLIKSCLIPLSTFHSLCATQGAVASYGHVSAHNFYMEIIFHGLMEKHINFVQDFSRLVQNHHLHITHYMQVIFKK